MDTIKRLCGVYRGVVRDTRDPDKQRRLKISVQTTPGEVTGWVWPMEPSSIHTEVPVVGQGVWVMFIGGDPEYPVWTGSFGKNKGLNKKIFIKPLANTQSLTGITTYLIVTTKPDGTSEVDLVASLLAMADKLKTLNTRVEALETKVEALEGTVETLVTQMATKSETGHTHP